MGCAAQDGGKPAVSMPKNLTIYGNILDVSTRNLMVILDRSEIKYKFVSISIMK